MKRCGKFDLTLTQTPLKFPTSCWAFSVAYARYDARCGAQNFHVKLYKLNFIAARNPLSEILWRAKWGKFICDLSLRHHQQQYFFFTLFWSILKKTRNFPKMRRKLWVDSVNVHALFVQETAQNFTEHSTEEKHKRASLTSLFCNDCLLHQKMLALIYCSQTNFHVIS